MTDTRLTIEEFHRAISYRYGVSLNLRESFRDAVLREQARVKLEHNIEDFMRRLLRPPIGYSVVSAGVLGLCCIGGAA